MIHSVAKFSSENFTIGLNFLTFGFKRCSINHGSLTNLNLAIVYSIFVYQPHSVDSVMARLFS